MKTLQQRKINFLRRLVPFLDRFDKEMIKDFAGYWSEIGANDKKMRFEKEKTFGESRRLATWKRNDNDWRPKKEEKQVVPYHKPKPKNEDLDRYTNMLEHIEKNKKDFLETGNVGNGAYKYYDWLVENGYIQAKIKNLQKYKREVYGSIKRLTLETLKFEVPTSPNENAKRQNRIRNIEGDIDDKIIIEAKETILKEYYSL
jgi:hypothetical protein